MQLSSPAMRQRWQWGRVGRVIAAFIMAMLLTACASAIAQPDATAGATPLPDEFRADALARRALWRQQLLRTYRIQFEFIEDATRPTVTRREATIINNTIRGARCMPATCPASVFKDMLTVNDIFNFMLSVPESCVNQVRYDATLYYPVFLSADCAEGITRPFSIRVVTLYPLN